MEYIGSLCLQSDFNPLFSAAFDPSAFMLTHKDQTQYTMHVNSSGAENGSYSLTFLGKKVGRHHSVAPAGRQRECRRYLRYISVCDI